LPTFNKGVLRLRDNLFHNRTHSISKDFSDDLINPTDKANRLKIRDIDRPSFLRNYGNEGGIEAFLEIAVSMEI
jgi:hypothetical protein